MTMAPVQRTLSMNPEVDRMLITGSAGQLSEATLRAVSAAVRAYLGPVD